MNDSVMYTFDVTSNQSHGIAILFRCARLETAEYLRDWCEAEEHNAWVNSATELKARGVRDYFIERLLTKVDRFSISESEVIL